MKLDQLSYFLEVAKTEHVGKAAKALAISPSAISHTIRKLEEELGRELFVKQGKRIYLTAHGKLLMERAKRLIQQADAIREEVQSDDVELRGHYRIAGTHVLSAEFLTPAWARVQKENSRLTSEIFSLRSSQVVSGVASGEFDFGICFSPQPHPDLESKPLRAGQLLVAVRKGHPLTKRRWMEHINEFTAVLPKAFQGIEVCERHPMFDKFGIKPKADALFDNYEVGATKVAESNSWGFFPDFLIKDRKLSALSAPKGWEAPYYVSAIWPRNRFITLPLRRLIDALSTLLQ